VTNNEHRAEKAHLQSHVRRGAPFSNPRTIRKVFRVDAVTFDTERERVEKTGKFKGLSPLDSLLQRVSMRKSPVK
jgi:hypothetical protein